MSFLENLEREFGPEHVLSGARAAEFFGAAAEHQPSLRHALGVLTPRDVPQAARIIQAAAAAAVSLWPCGGLTAFEYGNPAPSGALLLSTQKLKQMVAYEPQDMVATAQAGMTFGAFQAALAEKGQWLPLDASPAATLGGLLATDRSGPRRSNAGTLRDFTLGMSMLYPDGVLRKSGGRVVKNVTGYALEKLFIGSLGTLGLITEVTFKLRPRPEQSGAWELSSNTAFKAFEGVRELSRRLPFSSAIAGEHRGWLAVETSPADFARLKAEVAQAASQQELTLSELENPILPAAPWPPAPRGLDAAGAEPLVARLSWPCKTGEFPQQAQEVEQLAEELALEAAPLLEFPNVIVCELRGSNEGQLDALVQALRRKEWPVTISYRAPSLNSREPAFGPPRPEWEWMKKIKTEFDPRGIFSPGRCWV